VSVNDVDLLKQLFLGLDIFGIAPHPSFQITGTFEFHFALLLMLESEV